MRTPGTGFEGLISDAFTDHFRNPGVRVDGTPFELFCDFGSVDDRGRFFIGTFGRTETGTFGISGVLDRLMKSKETSKYTSMTPSVPLTSSISSSSSESTPGAIGGRMVYTWAIDQDTTFGLSDEYANVKDGTRSENGSSSSSYSQSTSFYVNENTLSSKIHTLSVGAMMTTTSGVLYLRGKGVFSVSSLAYNYRSSSTSQYNRSLSVSSYPTDVDTKAGLIGVTYETHPAEQSTVRMLLDVSYTSYKADGTMSTSYESGDSVFRTSSSSNGMQRSEGTVFEIRGGAGSERRISAQFAGFMGISLTYLHNGADINANSKSSSVPSPPTLPTSSTGSSVGMSKNDQVDLRIPLGVEYSPSEHVAFRAGVEPRYRSGEPSSALDDRYGTAPPSIKTRRAESEQRGLSFAAQFGLSAQHREYGEVSLLLGKNASDTSSWSFFIRYFF